MAVALVLALAVAACGGRLDHRSGKEFDASWDPPVINPNSTPVDLLEVS